MAHSSGTQGRPWVVHRRTFLLILSAYAVLTTLVLSLYSDVPTVVRVPFVLPLLLFAPGYAVVAALLPSDDVASPRSQTHVATSQALEGRIVPLERGVLSVIVSIAVVPMVVLVVSVVTGIALRPVLIGVTALTVVAAGIGRYRFDPATAKSSASSGSVDAPAGTATSSGWRGRLTEPVTLAAVLITGLLLVSSLAVSVTGNTADPLRTEFYVVNGTDAAGASSAESVNTSGPQQIYNLRIRHHRDASHRYAIVAVLDREGNGTDSDASSQQLQRVSTVVAPNETATQTYQLSSEMVSSDGTLRFLLYRDEPPTTPTAENAHRVLRFTLNRTAER